MAAAFQLRPYRADDEDAAIALWLETWQKAYPEIDFSARVVWWRERWRGELVPNAAIVALHNEGWVHFKESADQLAAAFATLGAASRLTALERGKPVRFD